MKYIVLLGDGMADFPLPQLDNKTPLQYAHKPNMDKLAKLGEVGMVKTIPKGISPGSDVANLSVMGYDPKRYYSGRSPLEAVSMGINLSESDIAFRCNLVTLSSEVNYSDKIMLDYCSDEISTEEARVLIQAVHEKLRSDRISFFAGISYRHCMVWKNGQTGFDLTPPHDISDRKITDYLPKGNNTGLILNMMVESYEILKNHPVNLDRVSRGLHPANSIWLWGDGRRPAIPYFFDKYGIKGSVISAVDLIKGIGICAGLKSVEVEGATGNIHTNFIGKAEAALKELESGQDFVYVHVEAPDECGHRYEIDNKVKSIELIDRDVLGVLLSGLEKYEDYKILILPDHPTPLSLRTHVSDPVPFILYRKSSNMNSGVNAYDEFSAGSSGLVIEEGHTLMDYFINAE